ncbi:hypothetical protein EDB85DRAFT_2003268, partial [Lactarius pseudohatsudake]
QARHRPERQAVCHPTPVITRQCNTQHIRPDKGTRELLRLPPSQGYSYTRGRISQGELPPLPPFPTSAHTSLQDRPSPISPVSAPSRRNAASPTSRIHSRSLPVPPTPLSTEPPIPPLSIMSSHSSPASPDPGLAFRHHLTHLHHDHDPTPIFGVCGSRQEREHQSRPVEVGLGFW